MFSLPEGLIARSALYFRDPPRETRKSVRSVRTLRIIITFHRGGNVAVHSVLVKYVIFEKISSDPRKYRCKVRLAIHNGHHRDPVLDVYFGDFLETYDKKWFCSARVDLWGNVTLSDVGSIQKVLLFGIICRLNHLTADTRTFLIVASRPCRHGGSSREFEVLKSIRKCLDNFKHSKR